MNNGKKRAEKAVSDYYNRNTRRFLRFGQGRGTYTIHRAVFGPGVVSDAQAMHYVHECLLDLLKTNNISSCVDIGCGVGGSMLYLSARYPARFVGMTLSSMQAEYGRSLLEKNRSEHRCTIVAGSFLDPTVFETVVALVPSGRRLFYGIESFIHASHPGKLVDNISTYANTEDVVVICDDMIEDKYVISEEIRTQAAPLPLCASQLQNRTLSRFISRWNAYGLIGYRSLIALMESAHFTLVSNRDLTPYLSLGRPRDRFFRVISPFASLLPKGNPFWDNMIGGNALQQCIRYGIIKYRFMVFKRTG